MRNHKTLKDVDNDNELFSKKQNNKTVSAATFRPAQNNY